MVCVSWGVLLKDAWCIEEVLEGSSILLKSGSLWCCMSFKCFLEQKDGGEMS